MIEIPLGLTSFNIFFTTHDPTTLAQAYASATPTVEMLYTDGTYQGTLSNGVDLTWNVYSVSTGLYRIAIDTTDPLAPDRVVTPVVSVVMISGGVTQAQPLESFRAGPPFGWFTVVADGANTATDFEVTHSLADTTDSLKEALVVFIDGALAGQMRPATAYDATTNFVTVGQGGFPATPVAGTRGLLIFK